MGTQNGCRRIGLASLIGILTVGPFFVGYFFPNQTLVAVAITGFAFTLWLFGRRRDRVGTDLSDGLTGKILLALAGWVLLSSVWAVYARGNLDLIMQVITAYLAFQMLRQEATHCTRIWLLGALSIAVLMVAALGLLEYGGFFMQHAELSQLLNIEPQRDRLFSVFQYPNTAAAFFLVNLILQNAVLVQTNSLGVKLALASVSAVVASAFVFTFSRGVVLLLPLALLLLWVGLSRYQIISSLLNIASSVAVPVAVAIIPSSHAAPNGDWATVLLWTSIAAALSVLATWVVHVALRLSPRTLVILSASLTLLVVVGGVAGASRLEGTLPSVLSRVTQVRLSDITQDGRFEFLSDAMKLTARRPWGYGGGGWLRSYQQVQELNYTARDPHSHYALMLVETGVPGLLLLIAAISVATFNAFRARKGDPLRWAMATAALTLAAHAIIDIDLSYFMIWLLLWVLLGLSQPDPQPITPKQEQRLPFAVSIVASLATFVLATTSAVAAFSYDSAIEAVLRGDNDAALAAGMRAIRLDPINSQYRIMIPTAENVSQAIQLDPNNEELWRFVSQISEEQGDLPSALAAAQRALELRPMSVGHYEEVARLLVKVMTSALEQGQLEEAVSSAEKLIDLGKAVEERGAPSLDRQKAVFPTYPPLVLTDPLSLAIGKAEVVLGHSQDAETKLIRALKTPNLTADAALWLHALYARTGNDAALQAIDPQPSERQTSSPLYKALLQLPKIE